MSLGHGRIQRAVLAVLDTAAAPLTASDIGFAVDGCTHQESILRALRRLTAEGLVVRHYEVTRTGERVSWAKCSAYRQQNTYKKEARS